MFGVERWPYEKNKTFGNVQGILFLENARAFNENAQPHQGVTEPPRRFILIANRTN